MAYPAPNVATGNHMPAIRSMSEKKLGILHHASPIDFGWNGDIRKRYTDFLVNEVRRDGTVLHLTSFKETNDIKPEETNDTKALATAARPEQGTTPGEADKAQISVEDLQSLEAMLGSTVTQELLELNNSILSKVPTKGKTINLAVITDRAQRAHVHQEIRRIFSSRFETEVNPKTGMVTATPAHESKRKTPSRNFSGMNWRDTRNNRNSSRSFKKAGGDYLHFTLYKENKDTMDAINYIARMLKIKSSNFGFAGTKDRRAATTQRVSMKHQGIQGLNWLNSKSANIKLGDFSYQKKPIQLGQHGGNEFVIVIKNVKLTRGDKCSLRHRLQMTEDCVQTAFDHVLKHGFINYFGLQRFGTHVIGTHEIGMNILSGNFEGAIDAILHVEPALLSSIISERDLEATYHRDEIQRARGIAIWKATGDLNAALNILPKRFNAEISILRHLGRSPESRKDFCGALLQITRGLRNLYIHAYQSFVWNWVASARWSKYGEKVIKGDLILVESEANPALYREVKDMSEDINQEEEEFYQQARPLTAEEAESGKYTLFDIVLPAPGYDMLYPENDISEVYADFMGRPENGRLDPYNMRRRQKEFSLSGHYRKLIAQFSTVPKFIVRPYLDDAEQMHPTDLDEIKAQKQEESNKREEMRAVTSSWRNFAQNAEAFDDAEAEERRRRRAAERSSEPPEPRINEKWVETTLDGGSKRIKVEQESEIFGSGSRSHTSTNENMPPGDNRKGFRLTPLAEDNVFGAADSSSPLRPGDSASNLAAAMPVNSKPYGIPSLDGSADPAPSPFTPGEGPMDVPGFSPSPAPATLAHSSGLMSSEEIMRAVQKSQAERAKLEALRAEALIPPTVNPFKGVTAQAKDKAMNLTGKWRQCPPIEDMKIAVILNFRLNSSNYATICLRELMSTPAADPVPGYIEPQSPVQ